MALPHADKFSLLFIGLRLVPENPLRRYERFPYFVTHRLLRVIHVRPMGWVSVLTSSYIHHFGGKGVCGVSRLPEGSRYNVRPVRGCRAEPIFGSQFKILKAKRYVDPKIAKGTIVAPKKPFGCPPKRTRKFFSGPESEQIA